MLFATNIDNFGFAIWLGTVIDEFTHTIGICCINTETNLKRPNTETTFTLMRNAKIVQLDSRET